MMKKLYSTPEIEMIKLSLYSEILVNSIENGGSIIEDDLVQDDDEILLP